MSGLTKKIVYTDKTLSEVLGVQEGTLVSYAEISQGIHKYIKERNLKNPEAVKQPSTGGQAETVPKNQPAESQPAPGNVVCRDCGEPIPEGAVYCDMCGVIQ